MLFTRIDNFFCFVYRFKSIFTISTITISTTKQIIYQQNTGKW